MGYDDRYEAHVAVHQLSAAQKQYYHRLRNMHLYDAPGTKAAVFPATTIIAASRAGLQLSVALAFLDNETAGGHNEFGSDPTIFVGAGAVTRLKYLAYKVRRRMSGNRLMQGVGPMQLTYYSYQDMADKLGGCWKAHVNMRVGFTAVRDLIRQHGKHNGYRAFNGSGPAAEAYAIRIEQKASYYHQRLTA